MRADNSRKPGGKATRSATGSSQQQPGDAWRGINERDATAEFALRVLMLGWEFPPFISGGLGTACHGLTRAMNRLAVEVVFVLPASTDPCDEAGSTLLADNEGRATSAGGSAMLRPQRVPASLPSPYAASGPQAAAMNCARAKPAHSSDRQRNRHYERGERLRVIGTGDDHGYDGDLLGKIHMYAQRCQRLAGRVDFDVIHAHDWMTFPAAEALAAATAKPMIAHVHATEFDRTGENVNQRVYDTERRGMHLAEVVIAVSHRTRRMLIDRYGVPADKVRVVHNGIEPNKAKTVAYPSRPVRRCKQVLFLGRLTRQKGPGFFVRAAEKVLEQLDDVRFVVAGWGDLAPQMVEEVAARGLGQKMLFAGFLRGADVDRAFREADVYVMPSVSEPFGLTALEAIRNGTPVVISRSSGVAEVLERAAMTVDCWDVDAMARHIVDLLTDSVLAESMCRAGAAALERLTWDPPANQCLELYRELMAGRGLGSG